MMGSSCSSQTFPRCKNRRQTPGDKSWGGQPMIGKQNWDELLVHWARDGTEGEDSLETMVVQQAVFSSRDRNVIFVAFDWK